MAGRSAAGGLRARDRRRRPAPGRLPRHRDRRGRPADRRRRAGLARGQAADDRPRRQRDCRRDLHGRGRRHPPLRGSAQADRLPRPGPARPSVRCRAGQPRPHLKARLKQRPPRARRSVLVDRPPARARSPRSTRASKPSAATPIAIVASARKLACLFWCLLTRGEDYAFAQPSLTTKKMRRLELTAGAQRRQGGRDVWSTNTRDARRRTRTRAPSPAGLRTHVADWQAAAQRRWARARHRGAHHNGPQRAKPRGRPQAPDVCTSLRQSLAPTHNDAQEVAHKPT